MPRRKGCRDCGRPKHIARHLERTAENVFVPSEGYAFVAPTTIVHYIDAHEYAPPELPGGAIIAPLCRAGVRAGIFAKDIRVERRGGSAR